LLWRSTPLWVPPRYIKPLRLSTERESSMTRKALAITLAALAGATMAAPARADLITIDTISTAWQNPVGGANIVINNTAGLDTIRWGTGQTPAGPSGYNWLPEATPFVAPSEVPFSLGTFTHVNQPISATADAITSVDQAFTVGTFQSPATLSATCLFSHEEIFNGLPCAYPCTTPCADRVTVSDAFFNAPFLYNDIPHFFTLLGFSTDGGATISTVFVTQEGMNNNADLYAIITHTPVGEVPEPTSLVLIGSGLLAAAARKRLRR